VKFSTLEEIVAAAHLTPTVENEKTTQERGGLMLVAPPGHLKTTAIEVLDDYPRTMLISNITNGNLGSMRESFISGDIKTIAFPDYDMLYKRHSSVSSQLEGTLMGLMGEGFRNPAFKDQRIYATKARVTVIGGITLKCYEGHIPDWLDSGFARRFLWCKFRVKNQEVMEEAIAENRRHKLNGDFTYRIPNKIVPYSLTKEEGVKILWQLRFQPDRKLPQYFAQRLVCVLKWKYTVKEAWNIWNDFVPSLGKDGAEMVI
jgi:hypothetical protein